MSSPSNASTELPPVDERLVVPDSGFEIDDGKLVRVSPAQEPHANRNSKLAALLEAHVAGPFDVAVDMLTRTSATSDLAPDASVYPVARDPRTGGRQLEQLAFEIVSTESIEHAGRKARSLAGRGVRRVFAIDVEHGRAFEWSRKHRQWRLLGIHTSITDPTLAVPLPVRALLQTAKADDAIAAALHAKHNPILEAALDSAEIRGIVKGEARGIVKGEARGIVKGEARGIVKGEARGMANSVLAVLASRALGVSPRERGEILRECDPARLKRWLARAATCATTAELLAVP